MAQKFLTDIEVTRGLVDSSGDLGVVGQVLSSTGSGTNWITNEANSTVVYLDEFTGNNSTVDFTISVSVTDENITQVYIDGVYQNKNTYSVSGTTLTFSTAPPLNADIEVITFSTATTSDDLAAGSVIIPVKNTHTASIAKGEPVYITGNVGSSARLQIAPADASNSAKMPAAGLLLQSLAVNAEGYVITGGYLRNITTDTIDGTGTSSNDTVYVKSGGGLTMTKPTGTNLIQNIAKVARSSGGNSGSLLVSSILRTNDVPNITNDYFWLGNSSGVATPTEFTSTARGLLSVGAEGTAAGDGNLAYNNSSGVFTYTPPVLGGLSGTTDNITEGSTNLYYTDARSRSSISSGGDLSYNSTTGVMSYTTPTTIASLSNHDTDDLSEGATNLYYTDARVGTYLTNNSYATQSYVNTQVSNLVDSAPSTLDTLNELAAALGDDANFSTTITNSIATKLPLAGGNMTGAINFDQTNSSGGGDFDFIIMGYNGSWSNNQNGLASIAVNDGTGIVGRYGITYGSGGGRFVVTDLYDGGYGASGDILTIAGNGATNLNGSFAATGNVTGANLNISNWDTAYGWGNHASAGYLTSFTETNGFLGDGGNASTHPGTSRLIYSGQVSAGSGVLGMPTSNNANAFINLNKHSGEYNSQLGFSSDGNIYYRNFNNAAINNSTAFRKIWDSGNDGSGSGLDADLLDGQHASAFASSSHTHAASDITSGNLAAARNTVNLANVASSSDASGVYFRSANEVISGEGWATAQYAYNQNDGFLFLNRNSSYTAFPTFHIGGWNNAGYISGYSDADGLLTLTRSDGTKSTGSTYAGTGLSNTSYYTNIIKTTGKTVFRDAQSLHEFTGNVLITGSGSANSASLQIDNPDSNSFNHSIEAFAANLTNGESNIILVGKEGNTKNSGYLGYYWTASGSDNNFVSLGHWGADHLFRVYGDSVLSTVTLRSDVDMQAPYFYHKGNTSYYLSPGSGGNSISANLQGRIQVGTFNQSQTNTGEAWIGRAADRSQGVLTVQLGTGTGRKFEVVDYGWTTVEFSADDSGVATAAGSFRAPIFYDSNDTNYFVDPASTSVMSQINLNVGGLQLLRDNNYNAIWWAANNDANHAVWNDYYGGPAGRGAAGSGFDGIKWNAYRGIHIRGGTAGAYNCLVITNTSSNANTHTVELYAYDVKQFETENGYALAPNQMRSPIFYDSNNTSFYVDTSNAGTNTSINAAGVIRGNYFVGTNYAADGYTVYKGYDNWNHFISIRGHTRPGYSKTQAAIAGGHQTSFVEYAENNSTTGWFFIGSANSTYEEIAKITKDFASFTQVRAPIFYDSNNTNYYTDPHSISVLNGLQFGFTQHGSANNIRMGNQTTMNAISSGTNNAAFGVEALGNCSTGSRNFAYGYAALFSVSSGSNNIAMGDATGYNVTSGSNNLLFGINAGRTGYQSPQSIAGVTTGSNQIHMGNESHTTARIQISWTVNSDARDKTDVEPIDIGLNFVNQLNPVTFRWDKRSDYEDRTPTGENKLEELTLGFLAQEVETVEKSYGYDVATKTNLVVDRDVEQDHFGITYEKMIPILTKAIQELTQEVQTLKDQINGIN